MDKPLPLSLAIITCNEGQNLPRCLASVGRLAAEIVVIDSGSTDNTAEIARQHQAHFEFAPWPGFLAQKNKALQRCSQPWVLCLDADEALSPQLAESVAKLFAAGPPPGDGFWLNRRTFYLGDWIWHAWYPEWILRLVRREAAEWTGLDPHPSLAVRGATARLAGDLLHYPFRDLQDHLQRTLKYARLTAQSYQARGKRFHWYHWAISPGLAFLKHLLLKQGWRDGWRGWLVSFSRGLDVFAKYSFLLEEQRRGERKSRTRSEPSAEDRET
jgi:glycosyltransferase involved in cell wall biosynthesis